MGNKKYSAFNISAEIQVQNVVRQSTMVRKKCSQSKMFSNFHEHFQFANKSANLIFQHISKFEKCRKNFVFVKLR